MPMPTDAEVQELLADLLALCKKHNARIIDGQLLLSTQPDGGICLYLNLDAHEIRARCYDMQGKKYTARETPEESSA